MNEKQTAQLSASPYPEIGDLDQWINAATRGLCAPAKEKIHEEISDHYYAAVQERVADGMATEEAELQAVVALGSPQQARKGFRKAYPTQYELDDWHRPKQTHWWLPLFCYFLYETTVSTSAVDAPALAKAGVSLLGLSFVLWCFSLITPFLLTTKTVWKPFISRVFVLVAGILQLWYIGFLAMQREEPWVAVVVLVTTLGVPLGLWRLYVWARRNLAVTNGHNSGRLS